MRSFTEKEKDLIINTPITIECFDVEKFSYGAEDDYKGNWEHIPYDFSITSDDEEFKPSASGMPLFDDLPIF